MKFIIACDLEGIHGVVGEPMKTLTESFDYQAATEGAILEIDTAAKALFDCGASEVLVWDNHGANKNLDFSKFKQPITRVDGRSGTYRWDFIKDADVAGVIFLGYHAKEGTPNGVLAHTFSSKNIQYVKLNGQPIGELYADSRACAALGIKPMFHASDDVCVDEMQAICPWVETVVTKIGKGRNRAELRDREAVLNEIYKGVVRAFEHLSEPYSCDFPEKAHLEVRYTRAERTERIFEKAIEAGIPVVYGEDTHVLHFEITAPNQIPYLL
jgi:D-amino peptidase